MAAEGISHIPSFLKNTVTRYGQGAVQNWGRARTLSRAINQGVRETPIQSTFEPKILDLSNPQNWNSGLWDTKYMQAIRRGDMAEA